ncbi:MAG TPA: hypothetical protein VI454_03655 [Verrucomicrobiae bacterium]|jgi:N-acetylglutamate synthase-like GNAT family acetyltransferase
MSQASYDLRRATVEDLPALRPLWQAAGLPGAELEKRFTEFQVAARGAKLLGGIGLRINGQHAWLHSETFTAEANTDELRALLWGRIQTVARNHGLARLWADSSRPFWPQQGFTAPTPEVLKRLADSGGGSGDGWLTLQLKEETAGLSLDHEFELFKQASREESEAIVRRAKLMKVVALLVALAVFALVVVAAVFFFNHRTKMVQ